MILLSPAQCRAARALLNWSQPDLAQHCGMHVQTISQFENDTGSPTKTTLQKITETFDAAGIEFLPNNGVSLCPYKTYSLPFYDVLNDVLKDLPDGGDLLFHCADEKRSPPAVIEKLKEISGRNIKMRATICEGNTYVRDFIPSRWIPKEYFAESEVFVIYADKFVVPIGVGTTDSSLSMIIKNKTLADAMRRQFEYWWKNGKPVPIQQ